MKPGSFIVTALLLSIQAFGQSTMPLTSQSEQAKKHFIQAREVLSSVWITGGIEELELALKLDSTLALAYAYQGASNFFLNKDKSIPFAAARRHAKNASEGEQWMIKGWIYYFKQNYDSAAFSFEQVVRLHPDEDYASHMLGEAYRAQNRYKDALAVLKPLVNKGQPYTHALHHIASTYEDMSNLDSALLYMQRFIDANPANSSAYYSMARLQITAKNIPSALLNFYNAVLADPSFAAASVDLANLLVKNGQLILAKKAYEQALESGKRLYGKDFFSSVKKKLEMLEGK